MAVIEPGTNGLVGGPLFGVERQLGLGQPVLVAFTRRMTAYFNRHQPFGQQQVKAVFAQHQFAQQLMRYTVGMLGQRCQCFPLTRRAGHPRVVKLGTGGDLPKALLTGFSQLALAQ